MKKALAPDVEVGLGLAQIEGVSVDIASQMTDAKGVATFNLKIDSNLPAATRNKLLKGIVYAINIKENSGATKLISGELLLHCLFQTII